MQRGARLRELAKWGVDLSLSYAQLHKSPDERLDEWLAMYAFAQEAARARAAGRIYPRHPSVKLRYKHMFHEMASMSNHASAQVEFVGPRDGSEAFGG